MKESSRFAKKYRSSVCLNCNTPLDKEDRYCNFCGQLNSTKKLSFTDFFKELFGSLFSYDSRIYKTLRTLLFQPGKASLDYIKGKRAQHPNPFRFYLSVSIIFFLLYGFAIQFEEDNINATIIENKEEDNITAVIKQKETLQKFSSEAELDTLSFYDNIARKIDIYHNYSKTNPNINVNEALGHLNHKNNIFNRWLYRRLLAGEDIMTHPTSFSTYAISKLPFGIFFFIPFFTLFLWFTYRRTTYTYMEHLVFAFHTQTVFFFIMTLSLILNFFLHEKYIGTVFLLYFSIYLFFALRKFYRQPFFKTLFKYVFLSIIFIILAIITTLLVIMVLFVFY